MAYTGIETAVQAVKAYLDGNLSTSIDSVNAEHSDGIAADYVRTSKLAVPAQLSPALAPIMLVLGKETRLDADNAYSFTEQHPISVVFALTSADPEILTLQLYRTVAATVRCLNAASQNPIVLGGCLLHFQTQIASYTPVLAGKAGGFFQDAHVGLILTLGEAP